MKELINILTKEYLEKEYIANNKAITQIAKDLGCNYVSIFNYLKKNNIKLRTRRESHLGKKRPEHSKLMMGEGNPIYGIKRSKEVREKISKTRMGKYTGRDNPNFGKININNTSYAKGAYYKNIWMRSSWEIKYAQYLDKYNIKWEYEPEAFDLGKNTYRPDFYLLDTNEYIEIKGRWLDNAKEKFELFKRLYFNIQIKVLTEKELKILEVL